MILWEYACATRDAGRKSHPHHAYAQEVPPHSPISRKLCLCQHHGENVHVACGLHQLQTTAELTREADDARHMDAALPDVGLADCTCGTKGIMGRGGAETADLSITSFTNHTQQHT